MNQIKIKIKQENISRSCRKNSHECMIADAIQETVPWAKYVMVDLQSIRVTDMANNTRHIYLTPPIAQQAILAFDRGDKVSPFQMTLSQGYKRQMRCRVKGYKKSRKTYAKTGKRQAPSRYREYGVRALI